MIEMPTQSVTNYRSNCLNEENHNDKSIITSVVLAHKFLLIKSIVV